ncbi:MAG: NADP-dependent malic enzyme [Chloroflexota bacterium]|nr:NADP-dependent malic enzyme [Chloroflexota bacterium]
MLRDDALEYHAKGRPGKIAIAITKPGTTQRDLSLAYTPGVAEPVREIAKDPEAAYRYTAKGNLVAVVTNGTAVLGLGNVGALAAKPVMEGKALLFKRFADVDVFDVEIASTEVDEIVTVVKALEPTFGGINLEDIKAPQCFDVERRLAQLMSIPVFHDDQHGTAIIVTAGLINALELAAKRLGDVRLVVSGAGAAAIATVQLLETLGLPGEHVTFVDSRGVVHAGRADLDPYKKRYAHPSSFRTLADAVRGADVFIGLSAPNVLSSEMVRSMAARPIVFALANPDPEISYAAAKAARPDVIMATGRSDDPNQVNNVLAFPYVFRGALDVRATAINEHMQLAAAHALAALAKEEVPEPVLRAYGIDGVSFGPDYFIPKALDPRVGLYVAPAVAKAAMDSGVARRKIALETYEEELRSRLVRGHEVMSVVIRKAQADPQRVVLTEGEEPKIIRAAVQLRDEGIARPILLGNAKRIADRMAEMRVEGPMDVIDPACSELHDRFARELTELRQRKGVTHREARDLVRRPNEFGAMLVRDGLADAFVAGLTYHYADVIRPALQIIGPALNVTRVAGLYLIIVEDKLYLFTDPTVNIDPTAEELAEIALMASDRAREFDLVPRVAMISFSNFGSTRDPRSAKVALATEVVKARRPDLNVDGEMSIDLALDPDLRRWDHPFSTLVGEANVLVFPDLDAANAAYKLMGRLSGATVIGPILTGMARPVHVLSRGTEVQDIVNIAAIAVVDAQEAQRGKNKAERPREVAHEHR